MDDDKLKVKLDYFIRKLLNEARDLDDIEMKIRVAETSIKWFSVLNRAGDGDESTEGSRLDDYRKAFDFGGGAGSSGAPAATPASSGASDE